MSHGSNTDPGIKYKTAAEFDAFTGWKRYYCYLQRAGVRASIKRQYRRRYRRTLKARLNHELYTTITEGF